MSRTPEGEIAYLPNPHLQENLAFCFQMQLACGRYPGFARKIYLKGLRYNLHLRGRSSLIEAGAQTNTKEEVWNAMAVGRGGGYGARSGDAEIDMQEFTHAETTAIRSCKEPEKMIS